jgi:hypothetical protein
MAENSGRINPKVSSYDMSLVEDYTNTRMIPRHSKASVQEEVGDEILRAINDRFKQTFDEYFPNIDHSARS